jgi:hypothetical protein
MAGEKTIEDCEFDVVPMLNPDGHMLSYGRKLVTV